MTVLARKNELFERAQAVIPGGMYGHQSIMYLTEDFPLYFERSEGAYLWDVDGKRYIDYLCAFGVNLFGYRDPRIEAAAAAQAAKGDSMTGPSALMVTLAEELTGMITHADWAMFCKNGSDATSMAMVIARAYRGKRKILLAKGAYHGASAWNTPVMEGVTAEDRAHIVYFDYDDIESLEAAVKSVDGDVAAIYATPFRHEVLYDQFFPSLEYAQAVRRLCDEQDALLVVDEVRTAFRLSRNCNWDDLGVHPDLSTWGKTIGGGYPLSALLGSDKAREAAAKVYVTGSYWLGAVPMAAALETLKIVRTTDYLEHTFKMGDLLRNGIAEQAVRHGFELRQTGPSVMPQMLFTGDDEILSLGRGWTGEAVKRGAYLHPYHNMFLTSSHTEADIHQTLEATEDAFVALKKIAANKASA
ncbi:aminotransferase class III-fold pyridoxal phosphate-dependent enzyme [Pseudomonas monteilii]|uniref:Aminotransferase class III-fold pyridoxal phosphate-dependent enzyme n=1 Tax=Pseudomonas monteilii TaxID=76759 RepID=A0A399MC01_9PSED|nr:aminotransferase class III-fold pyridoxal phosphate-dependent enzyme [Pseudomonas monteilii]RII78256.1 aminotransferase class III-fold pyridoxal phosphate-dependent enzyme [Pseudomonas monteilii]